MDKEYYDLCLTTRCITTVSRLPYQQKYNGQEYQDELGLNTTAMDFRQYDNAIGRFNCIDLLAENSVNLTPYHFGNNNPNFWSDPTGLEASFSELMAGLWTRSGNDTTWTNEGGGFWSTSDNTAGGGGGGYYNSSNGIFTAYGSGASSGGASGGGTGGGFSSSYVINNGSGNVLNELVLVRQPTKDANSGGFPSFNTLFNNYTMPYSPGPYSQDLYYNQCAIRLSISLIKSGVNLNRTKNYTNPGGQTFTSKGEVLGAYNLARSLTDNFLGKPEVYNGMTQDIPTLLNDRTGIIFFEGFIEDGQRTSQARHIDLWNGNGIRAPYYSQMMDSRTIWFWPIQ